MTGGQFREVDLDLLADYVGGALDGTPDEVEIARLVDQDPTWAEAYADLTAGLDAVRLDLAGWAAEPTPMPSLVVDRLTSALAGVGGVATAGTADPATATSPADAPEESVDPPAKPDDASEQPDDASAPAEPDGGSAPGVGTRSGAVPDSGPGPSGGSVPGGPTHPAGRPRRQPPATTGQPGGGGPQRPGRAGRRRRWARRMAGPILVATVVAGFAGFAVSGLLDSGDNAGEQTAGTAMNSGEDAAAPQVLGSGPPRTVVGPSTERVLATGTDYTPDSLPGTVSDLAKQAAPTVTPPRSSPQARSSGPVREDAAPEAENTSPTPATAGAPCCLPMQAGSPLERLADPSILAACLDAIEAAHDQGPVAFDLVDYATFQGKAALVVVFTDRSGARWAWVTGPDCGSPAAGADLTYQSRVG
ncbi:hypothetical protein [Plantactinospora mayteni]|uniref:Uncharacterized protein n=1 Tax=Plantactinospora mayteni TaxID=566021 RepID=A0ABQ4ETQ6_9ACTN|nr:hypothetical protein [Plantactinospora mayteni]GIG98036.1 hypothetical protein Pma05_46090 [Plantactinospora mayteni]